MIPRSAAVLAVAALAVASTPGGALAQDAGDAVARFYKGKAIELIIGSDVGGGYDTYSRVLARHLGKHVPGNPNVVPKNLPGAGSQKAASYSYNVAPKDGTSIAALFSGALVDPLLGEPKGPPQFDANKFVYLGSTNREVSVCIVGKASPAKTLKEAQANEILVGASAAGGSTRDFPLADNRLIGTKFHLVSGYPGTREIGLALERNEVAGICGVYYSSMASQYPDWKETGRVKPILQESLSGHPVLDAEKVPVLAKLAKPADKAVVELIYGQLVFGRPYVLPPNTPAERAAALRKGFMDALADPELLADADKAKVEIRPVSGEEVQALIGRMYAAPPATVARAKEILAGPKR
ncbi:MAG: Bug family tripartite tricarboxylate transporter substrate binding protein [Gemmatimonas sp.]